MHKTVLGAAARRHCLRRLRRSLMGISSAAAAAACLGLSSGCAHGEKEKALDARVRQEPVLSSEGLGHQAKEIIETSPHFTADQRAKLLELQEETERTALALRDESMRLRSLLIKDVVETSYKPDEIARIKKRIKRVEKERTALLFNSIEKVDRILGRKARPSPSARDFEFHERLSETH